jgi:hypothetical protein
MYSTDTRRLHLIGRGAKERAFPKNFEALAYVGNVMNRQVFVAAEEYSFDSAYRSQSRRHVPLA